MKVRYVSKPGTAEEYATLDQRLHHDLVDQRLTIGQEYLVLGLTFEFDLGHGGERPSVHILFDNGGGALCDLALFDITDPQASRYWQVHVAHFENRQFVDILPPELFSVLNEEEEYGEDDENGSKRDDAFFAALRSDEFRRVCILLRDE